MFVNPNLYLVLALGTGCFILGRMFSCRIIHRYARLAFIPIGLLLASPWFAFIGYYIHLFGEPIWYIEFRSIDRIELLSALFGIPFGFCLGEVRLPIPFICTVSRHTSLLVCLFCLFLPFSKPVLFPAEAAGMLRDTWEEDVCLQSSASTCGPSSLATVLASSGIHCTEREIARSCYSSATGTELWYLMRYARKRGICMRCLHVSDLAQVPVPAILGVRTQGYGHFIVLLDASAGQFVIADPLSGRSTMSKNAFESAYHFSGCVLTDKIFAPLQ